MSLISNDNSWKASVNSVCRRRSVSSKCAPKSSVNSVRSVREKSPQRVVCVLSHREGAFYFSQIYTEEQNTQSFTETLSQPISQNLTATFSYNVLWYLYAGGVLWVRNCAQICSVRSVSSVREKTPQREKKLSIPFACIPTRSVKNLYIQPSKLSSKWEGGVSFNRVYNPQEIKWLYVAFENMPFLPQEGRVLEWRKACSWMEKGMVLNEEGHVLPWWQAKIIDKWVRR